MSQGEDSAVDPTEIVLRRISKQPGHYDPRLLIPVAAGHFYPSKRDVDGLSFYRELFTSPIQLASASPHKTASEFVVSRIRVADILGLGLTLKPTPGDLAGHVEIPEITRAKYDSLEGNKLIMALSADLAKFASKNIITNF